MKLKAAEGRYFFSCAAILVVGVVGDVIGTCEIAAAMRSVHGKLLQRIEIMERVDFA